MLQGCLGAGVVLLGFALVFMEALLVVLMPEFTRMGGVGEVVPYR